MRNRVLLPVGLSISAVVFLGHMDKAHACKCVVYLTQALLPAPGAEDVPRNTRIWIDSANENYVLRLSRDGTLVPVSRSTVDTLIGYLYVMTPDATLLPNEQYEVGVSYEGEFYGPDTYFTTGTDIDSSAPDLPVEEGRSSERWNNCGDLCNAKGSQVVVTLSGEGIVVVDLGGGQTLDSDGVTGFVSAATTNGELVLGGGRQGGGPCGGPWPGERGETLTIRYGAFDLAGNFSGWTEESTVTMPEIPATCSCNCATATGRDVAPIAMLVVSICFLLLWRRRRIE